MKTKMISKEAALKLALNEVESHFEWCILSTEAIEPEDWVCILSDGTAEIFEDWVVDEAEGDEGNIVLPSDEKRGLLYNWRVGYLLEKYFELKRK